MTEYRQWMTVPKLMISASSDEFFLLDDYDYFFGDLIGEKYLWWELLKHHSSFIYLLIYVSRQLRNGPAYRPVLCMFGIRSTYINTSAVVEATIADDRQTRTHARMHACAPPTHTPSVQYKIKLSHRTWEFANIITCFIHFSCYFTTFICTDWRYGQGNMGKYVRS